MQTALGFKTETATWAAPSRVPTTSSIVDKSLHLTGELVSAGDVVVDGKFFGNIVCSSLVVSEGAVVRGEITADEVVVYGQVSGVIRAVVVQLECPSQVDAAVIHEVLTVRDGAVFTGRSMNSSNPKRADFPVEGAVASLRAIAAEMSSMDAGLARTAQPVAQPVASSPPRLAISRR